jgi:alginate O-acetyltransferase complex protein AlgI
VELTSLNFLLFSALVVILANLSRNATYRSILFLVANLVFVTSYINDPMQLAPLAGFLVLGYGLIEMVRRTKSAPLLIGGLVLVTGLFIYLKKYIFLSALPTLPFLYFTLGVSYMLFRIVHVMVDAQSGDYDRPLNPLHFLNYCTNFLTLISGPIQRFKDYVQDQTVPTPVDADRARSGFGRVISGYLKILAISAICNYLFQNVSGPLLGQGHLPGHAQFLGRYAVAVVSYTGYLYFNFAGYMDLVVGLGLLMGLNLPENFDKPFSATNFLEFWNRWHMTLSNWFKIYMFNPLLKAMMERITAPSFMPFLAVIAFFVTFLIMGIWHGSTAIFLIYGLAMGAGASLNKLWQLQMTERLGRKGYRALGEKTWYKYLCRGLTFAYFSIAVTALWIEFSDLGRLGRGLGLPGLAATLIGLTIGSAILYFCWDRLVAFTKVVTAPLAGLTRPAFAQDFLLAGNIILILGIASFFHKAPEFVYRAF